MEGAPPQEGTTVAATVPRWGLGDALAGAVVSQVLAIAVAGVWLAATDSQTETVALLLVSQPALWTGLLGAPLWASRRKGARDLRVDFGLWTRPADALAGIPVGVVCQLLLVPLIYLPFRNILDDRDLEGTSQRIAEKASSLEFAVLAVMFVVGAPLVEELFFRGLLLRSLARRFGPGWALAGSSLAFAVIHFEPLQTPALFAVGLVFGALVLRSGRLGPALWAHGAFNAVVVVALAVER